MRLLDHRAEMDAVVQNVHGHLGKETERACPILDRGSSATAMHAQHKDSEFPAFRRLAEEKAIIETIPQPYVYNSVRRILRQ